MSASVANVFARQRRQKFRSRYGNDGVERAEEDELITFGYSCTLFRDDEKATFMDEGRHLIFHPGDSSMTIDRYDGRLYLQDLSQYDPTCAQYDRNGRSEYDDVVESELDAERYRDIMGIDDSDEEDGDSQASASNVRIADAHGDSSSSRSSTPLTQSTKKTSRRDEKPFAPPVELELPKDIVAPKTIQSHAVIAKTAAFVATKGPQMEILIKAKEKSAGHFDFLDWGHELRPYYEHILTMIKAGRYKISNERDGMDNEEADNEDTDDEYDDNTDYLHPSLLISSASAPVIALKAIETQKQEPPQNMQSIIDRLADYVARNGGNFEDVVRSRKDELYNFIEPRHEFNWYYRQRLEHHRTYYSKRVKSESVASTRNAKSTNTRSSTQVERKRPADRREKPTTDRKKSNVKFYSGHSTSSSSSEEDEKTKRRRKPTGITFATFVPVGGGSSEENYSKMAQTPSGDETAKTEKIDIVPPEFVEKTLGLDVGNDDDQKQIDQKKQEERRAKAKRFLSMLKNGPAQEDEPLSKIKRSPKNEEN